VLGDVHPSTLSSINNLGGLLIKEGKFEEAGVLLRSALETRLRVLDERHLHLGYSHYNLGCLAAALGDREAALEHLRKAVDLQWAERAILEDEVLNALRGDPEFVAILDEVKRRLGED